jgi:hypothetical protein
MKGQNMARKPRSSKKGPPLTVGMLRKVIEGLPDSSLVLCYDSEDRGEWVAHSVDSYKYLNTDYSLRGACPYTSRGNNGEHEVYFELKEPIVMITFVRPPEKEKPS